MKKYFLFFFLLFFIVCDSSDPENLELINGLVAHYPFNGNANDESGKENHGIVSGAILCIDRFSNLDEAYQFDGINDYIKIHSSDILNLVDDFSISLWIYPEENMLFSKSQGIIGKIETDAEGKNGYVLGHQHKLPDNIISFFTRYDSVSVATFPLSINEWYNIVMTYGSNILSIYVNKTLVSKVNNCPPPINTNVQLVIGRWYSNYDDYYFKGKIDDIRIYDRNLDLSEIKYLYNENGW
ncbi:LamG domain-containing protein [bacterium]|nr:LamG domain-containing protein [bacterium]